jgi:1-acyl-sn-glycerol-3-phosphate acyltransferase
LEKGLYWFGRFAVSLHTRLMLRTDVHWHAPLPDGPKILAANHPTTTDPFYILTLVPDQVSVLVTEAAFGVSGFGCYLQRSGHVPAARNSGGATVKALQRKIEAGRTVAIFPEGALSPLEGGLHQPHTGAARLALITGAPVIPVGIGLQPQRIRFSKAEVDGEVAHLYLRGPYAMTVGQPLHFRGNVEDREYVRSVSEQIMQRIISLAGESAQRVRAPIPAETELLPNSVGLAKAVQA